MYLNQAFNNYQERIFEIAVFPGILKEIFMIEKRLAYEI
jgi:hypothetical protein